MTAGRVTAVAPGDAAAAPDVALPGGVLLPGFVDLQVNGYFGEEFRIADADGWARVVTRLPQTGTTAFLPTFVTAPPGALAAALRAASALIPALPAGAAGCSACTRGPVHLACTQGRAQRGLDHRARPPLPWPNCSTAGRGVLRLVTLAPERDGALAAITALTEAGVLVSVGHSDATARQVAEAADHGARMVTHLFNAQRPLHHREPGVVGQALTDQRLTSGLIADLHHVNPQVCVLAFRAAPGRICAVTDAAACAGMPPGSYLLGGEPIELPPGDGEPPVRNDGTLAGSGLRMDAAVANLVAAGIGLAEAVAAASRVPADLIGRPDLGRIAPGAAADLAWLGDDLRTRATWIGGELVFAQDGVGRRTRMSGQQATHMRTEIGEQPAAIRATIGALLPRAAEAAALASDTRQVLFIARGTSDNAAVYGSYLIQTHAGRLATLASPSIATTYRSRVDLGGVLAVALSQSGQTEEIVETLAWARDCGAATLAITNGDGSPLARDRRRGVRHPRGDGARGAGDEDVHHAARRAGRAGHRPRGRP